VDVAGPHLQRLEQDHVHELDDGRLVGDVEDVLVELDLLGQAHDVLAVEAGQSLVHDVRLALVGLVDEVRDLGPRREHGVDLAPEHAGEIVHRVRVERRARRDRHRAVGPVQRDQVVVAREVDGNDVHEVGRHLLVRQGLPHRDAEHVAEDAQDVLLRQVALVGQDAVQGHPAGLLLREALLEPPLVEQTLVEEDLLDPIPHRITSPTREPSG
jgi:hypothetical protein